MTMVEEVATTHQSNFQYQDHDSMEGLESENIKKDVEHQVHSNNIVYEI